MINELDLGQEGKGFNYIKNEGNYLGIIEEDHAEAESQMSDRGNPTELRSHEMSQTHVSIGKVIPSEVQSSVENTEADLLGTNDKVTSQINAFIKQVDKQLPLVGLKNLPQSRFATISNKLQIRRMSTNTERMVDEEIKNLTTTIGVRRSSTRASQLVEEELARMTIDESRKEIKEKSEESSDSSDGSNESIDIDKETN